MLTTIFLVALLAITESFQFGNLIGPTFRSGHVVDNDNMIDELATEIVNKLLEDEVVLTPEMASIVEVNAIASDVVVQVQNSVEPKADELSNKELMDLVMDRIVEGVTGELKTISEKMAGTIDKVTDKVEDIGAVVIEILDMIFGVKETPSPTASPSSSPTSSPTESPTPAPTSAPTGTPTSSPTSSPSSSPTSSPSSSPTKSPSASPTSSPTSSPTKSPSASPTAIPTSSPTSMPTDTPTSSPTSSPTENPSSSPTHPQASDSDSTPMTETEEKLIMDVVVSVMLQITAVVEIEGSIILPEIGDDSLASMVTDAVNVHTTDMNLESLSPKSLKSLIDDISSVIVEDYLKLPVNDSATTITLPGGDVDSITSAITKVAKDVVEKMNLQSITPEIVDSLTEDIKDFVENYKENGSKRNLRGRK